MNKLQSNRNFIPLATSALARARADWLYGINMTRAYTLRGRQAGYQGVLSVGRVQTPVLGLIVRRDLEIENFKPKDFFEVLAHIQAETPEKSPHFLRKRKRTFHNLKPYGCQVRRAKIIRTKKDVCFR